LVELSGLFFIAFGAAYAERSSKEALIKSVPPKHVESLLLAQRYSFMNKILIPPNFAEDKPSSHGFFCWCGRPHEREAGGATRRLFGQTLLAGSASLLTGTALAREGVEVGRQSSFARFIPAQQMEDSATQQYQQMLQQANQKRALAPANHPQVLRLRAISQRIIPHTEEWNPRAKQWKWEVNLIGSKQVNAFCMPGGKIAFYFGILDQLQLNDDEVAMIMGHEAAHALRDHARERMGKTVATRAGASVLSSLFGLGNLGDAMLGMGAQLLTLRFSREDESEADLVGIDLAARAGYNPQAGVTLWQKMMAANKGSPPQWMSTHPSNNSRIDEIQRSLPKVRGLYARAEKPSQKFAPPAQGSSKTMPAETEEGQ
jgi:Zn-dependent protease with chaperone function